MPSLLRTTLYQPLACRRQAACRIRVCWPISDSWLAVGCGHIAIGRRSSRERRVQPSQVPRTQEGLVVQYERVGCGCAGGGADAHPAAERAAESGSLAHDPME